MAFIVQSCAGKNAVYLFLSLHMIGYSFPHSLISRENSNAKCNFPCKEKSLVAFCDRSKWDRGFWKELQARFLPTDYRPWRLRGLYFLGGGCLADLWSGFISDSSPCFYETHRLWELEDPDTDLGPIGQTSIDCFNSS